MKIYTYIKKNSKFIFFLYFIVIIIMSSIPQIPIPKIKAFDSRIRLDYFVHFIEYFILSIFFILWRLDNRSVFRFKTFLLYIVIGLSIAFLDEFHQILIPGRAFNIIDFMLNCSGFIIGIFVMYRSNKVRGERQEVRGEM